MPTKRTCSLLVTLIVMAALTPGGASAQAGGSAERTGWPPLEAGARIGYDNAQRNEVAGVVLRVPVLPGGDVEVMPSVDVTFLRGLREYQYNFEAVYLTGRREGGLYAGGGIGLRNTILPADPGAGRQTVTTYNLVFGAKFGGLGRLRPTVEVRRVFMADAPVDPQQVTFGATIQLW